MESNLPGPALSSSETNKSYVSRSARSLVFTCCIPCCVMLLINGEGNKELQKETLLPTYLLDVIMIAASKTKQRGQTIKGEVLFSEGMFLRHFMRALRSV